MAQKIIDQLIPRKQMQFAPVDEDNDELSEIIKNDPLTHDDQWDLHDGIDADQLDEFWSDALKELGPLETEQDDDQVSI